jgi:hypothetical protein
MLVPAPVQQEIAKQTPARIAYAPARLAPGWRYRSWATTGKTLVIFFKNPAGQEIDFLVSRYKGDCSFDMDKSFQMAGVKTYWSSASAQQQAWRCVNGVKITAATSLAPNRFANVGLARLVASAAHLRR